MGGGGGGEGQGDTAKSYHVKYFSLVLMVFGFDGAKL